MIKENLASLMWGVTCSTIH